MCPATGAAGSRGADHLWCFPQLPAPCPAMLIPLPAPAADSCVQLVFGMVCWCCTFCHKQALGKAPSCRPRGTSAAGSCWASTSGATPGFGRRRLAVIRYQGSLIRTDERGNLSSRWEDLLDYYGDECVCAVSAFSLQTVSCNLLMKHELEGLVRLSDLLGNECL